MQNDIINIRARELMDIISEEKIDPRRGLPEDLFLLVSAVTPIPNVDLLIFDRNNRILLSWRDDVYYGKGWHFIGGCIRMHETMKERIFKTAIQEVGTDKIKVNFTPLAIRDAIEKVCEHEVSCKKFVRSHNVSILFKCLLENEYDAENFNILSKKENGMAGYLKWFDSKPDNILPALEETYGDILDAWNCGHIEY